MTTSAYFTSSKMLRRLHEGPLGVHIDLYSTRLLKESVETTQTYLHAHLALKEAALAKLKPYSGGLADRFRPDDQLLAFLNAL